MLLESILIYGRTVYAHLLCTLSVPPLQSVIGGHSLLLGPARVGRKSLAQVAAMMMKACVFTVDPPGLIGGKPFHEVLQDACLCAGIDQRQTVLIVDSGYLKSMGSWRDLIITMSEGVWLCKSLHS